MILSLFNPNTIPISNHTLNKYCFWSSTGTGIYFFRITKYFILTLELDVQQFLTKIHTNIIIFYFMLRSALIILLSFL